MRGANEADVVPLARFCLARGYQLRFIEQMPLGPSGEWRRDDMVTAAEILGALGEAFDLSPAVEPRGRRPRSCGRSRPARDIPAANSAPSPRSRTRSAAPATGRGSPPTARSAAASSPRRSPTSAPSCAAAALDDDLAAAWAAGPVGQAARPRDRRCGLRATGPHHERHRRMTGAGKGTHMEVRFFAGAAEAAAPSRSASPAPAPRRRARRPARRGQRPSRRGAERQLAACRRRARLGPLRQPRRRFPRRCRAPFAGG